MARRAFSSASSGIELEPENIFKKEKSL